MSELAIVAPTLHVSFYIAFDIGKSFVFKVHSEPFPVKNTWESFFEPTQGWHCGQFRGSFGKPLGWRALLAVNENTTPGIRSALEKTRAALRTHLDGAEMEDVQAVFFPLGIAALVITARLNPSPTLYDTLPGWRAARRAARDAFNDIIGCVSECYLNCMTAAADDRAEFTLQELREVRRGVRAPQFGACYPVFFIDGLTFARATRNLPAAAFVDYADSAVAIGWAEGYVHLAEATHRDDIQSVFCIATISWFALRVMDTLLSTYLLEAFVGTVSSTRSRIEQRMSRVLRLAYMDTANAAHPIRWTISEHDLKLLEAIHDNWSSRRWWKSIEERSALLALHHQQLQAEEAERLAAETERQAIEHQKQMAEHERRLGWIGVLGVVIAAFALSSAVSDVAVLVREKHLWSFGFAIGIPALIAVPVVWSVVHRLPKAPDTPAQNQVAAAGRTSR
jgi:hypothetical protein